MVIHGSGSDIGKFSFFKYTTCDGYTVSATGMERLGSTASGGYVTTLTGSSITWDTAPWTSAYLSEAAIPVGSLIIPCNSKGQPYVSGYFMGNDAVYCGYGSVNGKPSTAMGQRVTEQQDYTNRFGIGVQDGLGCHRLQKRRPRQERLPCGLWSLERPRYAGGQLRSRLTAARA